MSRNLTTVAENEGTRTLQVMIRRVRLKIGRRKLEARGGFSGKRWICGEGIDQIGRFKQPVVVVLVRADVLVMLVMPRCGQTNWTLPTTPNVASQNAKRRQDEERQHRRGQAEKYGEETWS